MRPREPGNSESRTTGRITRRTLLRTLGATSAVSLGVPLAGCTSDDGSGGGDGGSGSDDRDGGSGDGSGSGGTRTVDMTDNLTFEPKSVTVDAGDTVVWENVGTVGHSITAYEDEIPDEAEYFASGGFDSEQAARDAYPEGDVPGGKSWEHTFEVPGTYEYFCIPHEMSGMVGTITVEG